MEKLKSHQFLSRFQRRQADQGYKESKFLQSTFFFSLLFLLAYSADATALSAKAETEESSQYTIKIINNSGKTMYIQSRSQDGFYLFPTPFTDLPILEPNRLSYLKGKKTQWLPLDSKTPYFIDIKATNSTTAKYNSVIINFAATTGGEPKTNETWSGTSGLFDGYYANAEFTATTSNLDFDTTNVDAFSIPSRWTCKKGTETCDIQIGAKTQPQNPMGNPIKNPIKIDKTSKRNSNGAKVTYEYTRDGIFRGYQNYVKKHSINSVKTWQKAIIKDKTLSQYKVLLNPNHLTSNSSYNQYKIIGIHPFDTGLKQNLKTAMTSKFIISGAAGGIEKKIPSYNYIASKTPLSPQVLGFSSISNISNKGSKVIDFGNTVGLGRMYDNGSVMGLKFTQCTEKGSSTTGCTLPKDVAMPTSYLANPYTLNTVITGNSETKVTKSNPPTGAGSNKWQGYKSGKIILKKQDAKNVKPGMFLVSAGTAGGYAIDPKKNLPYSAIYVSSKEPTSGSETTTTVNLKSEKWTKNNICPSGQKCSDWGYIQQGPALLNQPIVFSWANDVNYNTSPANQIFGNSGVFAINRNDKKKYCGDKGMDDCDQSTIIGNLRNQVVTALNRGSVTQGLIPSGKPVNSVKPVNEEWGNVANWYKDNHKNPNNYNLYAGYLHTSGATLEANTDSNVTTFTGAAYAFGFDENANLVPNKFQAQVPAENGNIEPGSVITLTLNPWGDSSENALSNCSSACWRGGSGQWSSPKSWSDQQLPNSSSIVEFNSAYASDKGGVVNIDTKLVSVEALDLSDGPGAFLFDGNAITLSGTSGIYPYAISNSSGNKLAFNNAIQLKSTQPLDINTFSGDIIINKDLGGDSGWIKTGADKIRFNQVNASGKGPIHIWDGTLVLDQSDLTKAQSISSKEAGSIIGSGSLPGTAETGSIQGMISPGGHGVDYGQIDFKGNLSLGDGAYVSMRTLNEDLSFSDLIRVGGDLSISTINTEIDAVAPDNFQVGDAYELIKYEGNLSGQFADELLSEDAKIIYDLSAKSIKIVHADDPNPTGCLKYGIIENLNNSTSSTLCGGEFLTLQSGNYEQDLKLDITPSNRENRINNLGNYVKLDGIISGEGNVVFENTSQLPGIVELANNNTYTGSTTVRGNTGLIVNGDISSSSQLTATTGSTISGIGYLPKTILNEDSTISPGNSIGTLTAEGLDLDNATIQAEIQGPQNDRIEVTGNVSRFKGNANLIAFGGGQPWPNFNYTIINAPNSTNFADSNSLKLEPIGVQSALLQAGANLTQNADGNPKTFDVQWKAKDDVGVTTAAMKYLNNDGANQLATAGVFDRVFDSISRASNNNMNDYGELIEDTGFTTGQAIKAGITPNFLKATSKLLGLNSTTQLSAAVNSLSAQTYASFQNVALQTMKRQREILMAQSGNCLNVGWVVNAPSDKKEIQTNSPLCVFGDVANTTSTVNNSNGLSGYDFGIFSSYYGLEYFPSENWVIGASYGYGNSYLNNMSNVSGSITADVKSGSIYAMYQPSDRLKIRGFAGYGNFQSSAKRSIPFLADDSSIDSSPEGNGYTFAINADYIFKLNKLSKSPQIYLKPMAGFAWTGYQQNSFSESSTGALALNVQSNTSNSLLGTLGAEVFSDPIPLNSKQTAFIIPRLAVAYQVDALANSSEQKSLQSSFQSAPVAGTFTSEGQNLGVNSVLVDAGVDLIISKNISLYANLSYEAFSNGSQIGYGGGMRYTF